MKPDTRHAHRVLDLARAGQAIPAWAIDSALAATGDIPKLAEGDLAQQSTLHSGAPIPPQQPEEPTE